MEAPGRAAPPPRSLRPPPSGPSFLLSPAGEAVEKEVDSDEEGPQSRRDHRLLCIGLFFLRFRGSLASGPRKEAREQEPEQQWKHPFRGARPEPPELPLPPLPSFPLSPLSSLSPLFPLSAQARRVAAAPPAQGVRRPARRRRTRRPGAAWLRGSPQLPAADPLFGRRFRSSLRHSPGRGSLRPRSYPRRRSRKSRSRRARGRHAGAQHALLWLFVTGLFVRLRYKNL